jgi:membrane-associated HD superfamily phosphohydrolase
VYLTLRSHHITRVSLYRFCHNLLLLNDLHVRTVFLQYGGAHASNRCAAMLTAAVAVVQTTLQRTATNYQLSQVLLSAVVVGLLPTALLQ